jgi:cytochrome b
MREDTNVAIRVWDLPVRLFHWLVALLFVAQIVTGKIGGGLMAWHARFGYAILALVVFRVLWGFAGSVHARFADFVAAPAVAMRFAALLFSRRPSPYLGHNPLGGWSVIAMLALLGLQAVAGFFANDGISFEGPLARFVSVDTSNRIAHLHDWNANVLMVLVALHVAAVLYHWLVKGEDLMQAMFTGTKRVTPDLARSAPPNGASHLVRASLLLALAALAVGLAVYSGRR